MFQVVTRRIPQYCAKVLGLCTPSWAKFMGGQQKRLKKAAQFPLQHLVGGSSLYPRSLTDFFFFLSVCCLWQCPASPAQIGRRASVIKMPPPKQHYLNLLSMCFWFSCIHMYISTISKGSVTIKKQQRRCRLIMINKKDKQNISFFFFVLHVAETPSP